MKRLWRGRVVEEHRVSSHRIMMGDDHHPRCQHYEWGPCTCEALARRDGGTQSATEPREGTHTYLPGGIIHDDGQEWRDQRDRAYRRGYRFNWWLVIPITLGIAGWVLVAYLIGWL